MTDQVGVVIVTYNSEGFLEPCLEAALRAGPAVVIDNASGDSTVAKARRVEGVRVVANTRNLGFAGAVNQGFRLLSTPYVLLLNPDAILGTSVEPLVAACHAEKTGAATGQLVHPTGEPQFGFTVRRLPRWETLAFEVLGLNRLWPSNPVNQRYRCRTLDLTQPQFVEQPAGAFLLIKRTVWEELGGFDERFHPLWFEDVDFLARMAAAGYRVWYDPQVWAVHHGGHSIAQLPSVDRQRYWYDSLLHYAAKHFAPWQVRTIAAAVLIGAFGRMVTGVLGGRVVGEQFVGVLKQAVDVLRLGRTRAVETGHPEVDMDGKQTKVRKTQSHGL
jgi:GT2 family glycosyltransferase